MPVNFNQFQGIKPSAIIGQLPESQPQQSGGGDDLSELFGGLGKLLGGFNKPSEGSIVGQGVNPDYRVNHSLPPVQFDSNSSNQPLNGISGQMLNRPSLASSPITQISMNNRGLMPQNPGNSNNLNDLYKRPAFQTALTAQQEAFKNGITKSPIMTVVDYSIPSNQPRMWVIDTKENKILMNTYVAHGSGSGKGINATQFSNDPNSHASSLGTYLTDHTYEGKHGTSLRVRGLEPGVNDNAFARAVVVHGGNYVGADKAGNSWGCFTVPNQDVPKLIGLTKDGTIIHAYAPDKQALMGFGRQLSPRGQVSLSQQFTPTKNANPELQHTLNGISHVETGMEKDPYSSIGKVTKSGDRAYGKYQIMGSNIPKWSRTATGTPLTPQQFLSDPQAQERIAAYIINDYLNQGYSPQDAASMWFTGRPTGKVKGTAKDAYGTTNNQYQKKFNKGYLNSKGQKLSYNSIHPQQSINYPNTAGKQPPQIPKEIMEEIIRQLDAGKSYEG